MTPARAPSIRARRWNDPAEPGDGTRVLVCRYRPRGVRKKDETWDEWRKDVSPSPELIAAFKGKGEAPIPWSEFRRRYLAELGGEPARAAVAALAARAAAGERMTLLCTSSCVDENRCHRTLLRDRLLRALTPARAARTTSRARRAR